MITHEASGRGQSHRWHQRGSFAFSSLLGCTNQADGLTERAGGCGAAGVGSLCTYRFSLEQVQLFC